MREIRRSCVPLVLVAIVGLVSGYSSGTATATSTRTPLTDLTAGPTATADVWTMLEQRQMQVPTLAPGSPCPAAHGHAISPSFGLGLGDGPAYAVGLGSAGRLDYAPPANFGSHVWGGQKVLWAVDTSSYPGVVLIRGHQVDGPNEVRFERGDVPPTELRVTPSPETPDGWTGQPSYTRVRAPGCYAYQVDGLTFSQHILFQAVPAT
jgi:hypothetical protein